MKNKLKRLIALGFLGIIIALTSCDGESSDDDDDMVDPRDKFVGSWNVEEKASNDPAAVHYTANVDYSQNSAYIKIHNIYFLSADEYVEALVTGDNLTISPQTVCDFEISGSGRYVSGDKFTLDYQAEDNADIITINSTYTK